jgi:hypothetical protein
MAETMYSLLEVIFYNYSADGEKSSVTTRLKASQWRDGKFRSDIFRPYTKAT